MRKRVGGFAIRDVIDLESYWHYCRGGVFWFWMELSWGNVAIYWTGLILFWVIVAFLFGIYMHWLFCVETTLNKMLGLV